MIREDRQSRPRQQIHTCTDALQTYSAIACGSNLVTWQRQVLGISALVSPFQPTRFALAMESFLFQQIRVAQVRYTAVVLCLCQKLTVT